MKRCAYCGNTGTMTKEHIIPNWFVSSDKRDSVSFLERASGQNVPPAEIKDVCRECNNGCLSRLDDYGRSLYEKYFKNFIFKNESIDFKYDYQKLLQWLIKCSYNSARANNTDISSLKYHAKSIITSNDVNDDILIFCKTISPTITKNNTNKFYVAARSDEKEIILNPYWFRIGVFNLPETNYPDYCFRTVMINSYAFFIALPAIQKVSVTLKRKILAALNKKYFYGKRLSPCGNSILLPPNTDAYSSIFFHISNNRTHYNLSYLPGFDFSKKNKLKPLAVIIDRNDIEKFQFNDVAIFLAQILSTREIALSYIQKIHFCIHGYNEDDRELYEIDDVVKYISELNRIFPYWLFYQDASAEWTKVLIGCLAKERVVMKDGLKQLIIDRSKLKRLATLWFDKLNELCHTLCISNEVNMKISQNFISEILEKFY